MRASSRSLAHLDIVWIPFALCIFVFACWCEREKKNYVGGGNTPLLLCLCCIVIVMTARSLFTGLLGPNFPPPVCDRGACLRLHLLYLIKRHLRLQCCVQCCSSAANKRHFLVRLRSLASDKGAPRATKQANSRVLPPLLLFSHIKIFLEHACQTVLCASSSCMLPLSPPSA